MDRKKLIKKINKAIPLILLLGLICMSFSGCGEEYIITINDAGARTEMAISSAKRVSVLLDEAGITVGPKDEVVPALDEKVTEAKEIEVKRYADVTIIGTDGTEYPVSLVGATVADAIDEAGITLGEGQTVSEEMDDYLQDGMTITVIQLPSVSITADGDSTEVYTAAETVGALLEEQEITLGENDRITPETDALIEAGMEIVIQRVEIVEETETETISYKTETQNSSSMNAGTRKVKQKGENGEKEVTYSVTYVDGEEESREVISEKTTKEPVTEIIVKGTKEVSSGGGSSSDSGSSSGSSGGKSVVSEQYFDDCDGSGHGVKITTYSDGTTKQTEY